MPSLSGADKVADRLATLEGKLDTLCLLFTLIANKRHRV